MNRSVTTFVMVAALALTLPGCLHHTFSIGAGSPQGELVYKNWHHHWLFGTIRPDHQKDLRLMKLCPSGNATIYEKTSFINGLVDFLIGVIYSPTTVTILCDDGTRKEVEIPQEEVARLVRDPLFREVVAELLPERVVETELALGLGGRSGVEESLRVTSAGDGAGEGAVSALPLPTAPTRSESPGVRAGETEDQLRPGL